MSTHLCRDWFVFWVACDADIFKFRANSFSACHQKGKKRGRGRVAASPVPQPASDEAECVKAPVVSDEESFQRFPDGGNKIEQTNSREREIRME